MMYAFDFVDISDPLNPVTLFRDKEDLGIYGICDQLIINTRNKRILDHIRSVLIVSAGVVLCTVPIVVAYVIIYSNFRVFRSIVALGMSTYSRIKPYLLSYI